MLDLEKLEELKKLDKRRFPKLISELINLIGFEPALKIFVNYSGSHLFIPLYKTTTGELEQLIGDEAFKKISLRYGSEVIWIPSVDVLINSRKIKIRNSSIFNEWKNGALQRELAVKYSVSERTINTVVSKYKP